MQIEDYQYQKKLHEPLVEAKPTAGDYDDALACCVENTVEDRIMDSGASFNATYCKEELERFKQCSGKVRLANDMTLDIAGVGDVVLKTYFGKSWTLKDVRYIPGLKRRLISVGQLDEEGYHVDFEDQQWKVTKGSLVVARGNKRGSLHMVKDWYEQVSFQRQRSRCTKGLHIPKEEWLGMDTSLAHLKVFGCDSFVKVKDVYGEAIKCTFIGNGSDEMRYSFWDTKNMSEGSENSGSFEDSGRSDKEDSEDEAFSKEGGSETPQVQRSTRESRAPVRYSSSANYLLLTENEYQHERRHHKYYGCSRLKKSRMAAK
nr:retrovirus-related Pol polyprotein from transposon TNT 1-94 [Tanacetum cinerariifolium]